VARANLAACRLTCDSRLVPLAVGMGAVLRSLLVRLDSSPWGLLQAVPPVPMAAPLRQAAVLALQAAVQVLTTVFHLKGVLPWCTQCQCQQRLDLHLCGQMPTSRACWV